MMFTHNERISTRQVVILLILEMFNMNMLIIPRVSAYYAGRNGYVLPVIAIILGVIYVWCITKLTMKFPNQTLVEISKSILPNGIAYLLLGVLGIKMIIGTGLELRIFGELILQVILPKTPIEVIILVMLIGTSYLVKSGIEATARMAEVLIYFISVPIIIVLLIIGLQADYKELLPFFDTNIKSMGEGVIVISYMFAPLEFLLMMTGLMRKPEKARKMGIWAVCIIGILQGILTLFTISEIGLGETERQVWPVLGLMQSVGLSSSMVENQEVILLCVWVLSVFMYAASGLYFSGLIGSRSLEFKRQNLFVLPIIPIVFFIAMWPRSLIKAYKFYLKFQVYFGIWFIVLVPLVLLLIAKLRRMGDEK